HSAKAQAAKCTTIMEKILHSLPKDAFETSSKPLKRYVKLLFDNGINSDEAKLLSRDISAIMLPKVKKEKAQRVDIVVYIRTITPGETTEKLRDPGSFVLDCSISTSRFSRSLCDLGSSINLMPKFVAERLSMTHYRPTRITLLFVDRSKRFPEGILEDVLVKVGNSISPADFVVLDYEKEPKDPLILGRAFLATAGSRFDAKRGRISLKVWDLEMEFGMDGSELTKPINDSAHSLQPTPLEDLCDKFSSISSPTLSLINSIDYSKTASLDNKPRVPRMLVSPVVLAGDENSVDQHTTKCRSTPANAPTRSVYTPPWKARRQQQSTTTPPPSSRQSIFLLPNPVSTSIRDGSNNEFCPSLENLYPSVDEVVQMEGVNDDEAPIRHLDNEAEPMDEAYATQQFYFEEYSAPRQSNNSKKIHKHLGFLQSWCKLQDKDFAALNKKFNALQLNFSCSSSTTAMPHDMPFRRSGSTRHEPMQYDPPSPPRQSSYKPREHHAASSPPRCRRSLQGIYSTLYSIKQGGKQQGNSLDPVTRSRQLHRRQQTLLDPLLDPLLDQLLDLG
ncbi:hypothetical protein ISN44_Un150g000010, partial [Arabidopsis suecica]